MNKRFLLLYGYGWSGSGAVLDFLKENESIELYNNYFFLIRDKGGLIDLYSNLVENWDMFRSSVAINDFLQLCNRSKKPMLSLFSTPGRDYKNQFGSMFDNAIATFIAEISDFKYYGYEHSLNMSKSFLGCMRSRLIHQLDKRGIRLPLNNSDYYYFSKPSREEFFNACQKLLNRLIIDKSNKEFILMDHHPLPIHNSNLMFDFFGRDSKMIVVDRDPRDIYIDLVNNRMRIGSDLYRTNDVRKYITWHKKSREFQTNNNVLFVRFEELIFNYTQTVQRILDFLGLNSETHILKQKFFNPDISIKNIGMWKRINNKHMIEACETIKIELPDFCYGVE